MAKGKQAARSANRRYQAAADHLDRTTDRLLEAKERARRFEADAMAVPGLRAEVDSLHRQLAAVDSDKILALKADHATALAVVEDDRDEAVRILAEIITIVGEEAPDVPFIPTSLIERLSRKDADRWIPVYGAVEPLNRAARRGTSIRAHATDRNRQDNGRTLRENAAITGIADPGCRGWDDSVLLGRRGEPAVRLSPRERQDRPVQDHP